MEALRRYGYLAVMGLREVRVIYALAVAKGHAGRAAAALAAIAELEAAGCY